MDKRKRIDSIYKVLALFDSMSEPESDVTPDGYINYLERIYVWYMGYGNDDISTALAGLKRLGIEATKHEVKGTVFHIISILEKGG